MRVCLSIIVIVLALGPASSSSGLGLYWSDHTGIHRYPSSDPLGWPALFQTFETRGMAVDSANGHLWWSDVLPLGSPLPGGVIRTGSTKGGETTNIVTHLTSPAGVALDAERGRVYWSDLGDANHASAIFSANLDGSDVQELIRREFITDIAGIAFDPTHEKLYFTYLNPLIDSILTGGIARVDLDGSNLEPIVSGQGMPIGIAVDPIGGGIYWADAMNFGLGGTSGNSGAIKAAGLDGENQRTILGGLDMPYGVALDVAKQDVYWTDMGSGKIQRTAMSGILPFFEDVLTGLNSPTAIAIASTLPGDYSSDGVVDAGDYVVWRETDGTQAGYDTWRSHFGQTASSGAGVGANAAIPEPATLMLMMCAAAGSCLRRGRAA